jgi:outer membrane protein
MKIFITILVVLATVHTSMAQGRIGYINPNEVLLQMPEIIKADNRIKFLSDSLINLDSQYVVMYQMEIAAYVKDSLTMLPSVKTERVNYLNKMRSEIQQFERSIDPYLDKQRDALLKPIKDKLLNTIQQVAKENKFDHVHDKDKAFYFPAANDITALVRKKLGIK